MKTERDVTKGSQMIFIIDIEASFKEIMAVGDDTQRMIEEIECVLGKDPNSSFTSKYLPKLEYVEVVIKEEDVLGESDTFIELDAFDNRILNCSKLNRYTQYLKDVDEKRNLMFFRVNTERERIADGLHDKSMSANYYNKITSNEKSSVLKGILKESDMFVETIFVDFLENNPKIKQRMMEEIEHVLGKDPNSSFTSKYLPKLEYVEAVIKEDNLHYYGYSISLTFNIKYYIIAASRLCSIVPLNFKYSVPEVRRLYYLLQIREKIGNDGINSYFNNIVCWSH
ncbi:hypothetical protein Glove_718g52 [Diversispora epigaea]|uniref:Uncharacterized protein n=1 Tax=Diversispora epigaea TaxID=1348612 RepID=A0A397G3D6_9GLOM|nr:hypothetical protein Glove_718g52 [Diversispora epigaea]